MKLFGTYKLDWWQIGMVKIALFFFGIVVGAYWYIFWMPYLTVLLVVAAVLALYLLVSLWGKAK